MKGLKIIVDAKKGIARERGVWVGQEVAGRKSYWPERLWREFRGGKGEMDLEGEGD